MNVLVTCKYEEDPIKNRGARVFTTLYVNFSDAQGQITLESVVVPGRNLNTSKLSCMSSLPARMRMIESKNEGARVFTRFLRIISLWEFFQTLKGRYSSVLGLIWQIRTRPRCMDVLVTCKYEEDPIKMKELKIRVDTTFSPL